MGSGNPFSLGLRTRRLTSWGFGGQFEAVSFRGGLISLFLISLLFLLIRPIPSPVLDILLTFNLFISLTLLFRALFTRHDADFSSFPALLLFTTVFRLALNVSSTRLILLYGDRGSDSAGQVIQAFGAFMVQGDFLVGAIIFTIIAVVNFMVISRGAARVAEVAARFALDTVPGKQLSIDSDLRSGVINSEEASRRRGRLVFESQFFGAMDGGMKFVQGDALSCIVIALINSLGGFAIGVMRGLGPEDAFRTFGLLAIGDGLISIIPALIVSIAAGLLVTRISQGNQRTVEQFVSQVMAEPSSVLFAGVGLVFLGVFSGFPLWPSLLVGGGALALLTKAIRQQDRHIFGQVEGSEANLGRQSNLFYRDSHGLLSYIFLKDIAALRHGGPGGIGVLEEPKPQYISELALEVDSEFLAQYIFRSGPELEQLSLQQLLWERKLVQERGLTLPAVDYIVSSILNPGEYRILVRGRETRRGVILPNSTFVQINPQFLAILGVSALLWQMHPVTGLPGLWVDTNQKLLNTIRTVGAEILTIPQFLSSEVVAGAIVALDDVLDISRARAALDSQKAELGFLIEEVFGQGKLALAEWAELLRRLISEGVSVRDVKLILESVAEYVALTENNDTRSIWFEGLYQHLRLSLSLGILEDVADTKRVLRVFLLEAGAESDFRSCLGIWDSRQAALPLDPVAERRLRIAAAKLFQPAIERGALPIVLICSADVRFLASSFFSMQFGGSKAIRTLSYDELKSGYRTEPIGVLTSGRD